MALEGPLGAWLWLLIACGAPPAGPPVESAPTEPARPVPDSVAASSLGCADLTGRWSSSELQECGRGGARCPWRLDFEGTTFQWRYSDVGEGGRFGCRDGLITVGTADRPLDARFDGDVLVWQGVTYRPDAAVAEPTPAAVPAPVAPAPVVAPRSEPSQLVVTLGGIKVPALAASQQEARVCATTADCRVSTLRDGNCCPSGCGASNAYSASFLARLEPHLSAACADVGRESCPAVACAWEEYRPVCREGLCAAVKGF